MTHCYRRMLFLEVARDPSAIRSHMAPAIYIDKPPSVVVPKGKAAQNLVTQTSTVNAEPIIHPRIGAAINSTGIQEYYEIEL